MRPTRFRLRVAVLVLVASAAPLSACTAGSTGPAQGSSASDVVSRLGPVPIPTAAEGAPAPVTASPGHPQLLAMGAPVQVSLPAGVSALLVASGPAVEPPPGGAKPDSRATGTITLTASAAAGTLTVAAHDLQCRDETGTAVALSVVGKDTVTATPGHPGTLTLTGTFHSGGAQINWQQNGHVLAMWDFAVEID
ncbi:hypothetical protein [Amycolatopsis nalaikhensis]|uniref:Lipoprotein n=1 Tax=Amycolatopsis nalaikhensis TaxID=715472 RepID=A0ABY8XUJ4_9PSEU|nr:hypothetical protein [Amycolatopsis sp. 2-2]WIV59251.1 hypothetical protein QP939_11790 [Amycolatopsis sp. 2-2]